MALARLGDRRLQRATCPSTGSPSSRLAGDLLPDADARPVDRDRLQPLPRRGQRQGGARSPRKTSTSAVRRRPASIPTATVWLGDSTTGCARCHDHKYDPIRMKDYYQLFAFFNNIDGPAMDGNGARWAPVAQGPTPPQAAVSDHGADCTAGRGHCQDGCTGRGRL